MSTKDMHQLLALLPRPLGPSTHGAEFLTLRCYCDFEGHGRASETWEEHWELKLPQIPHHWRGVAGWKRGTVNLPMRFHGATMRVVVEAACDFLEWWKDTEGERRE